jgi:hypothetical protein
MLIAGVCLIAGMVAIGLPASDTGALRYFAGGVLVGIALLLLGFGPRPF